MDDAELRKILERIGKLSVRPPSPGLAYRNLEMIEALVEKILKETGGNGKRTPPRQEHTKHHSNGKNGKSAHKHEKTGA